jgi:hypothetical protein
MKAGTGDRGDENPGDEGEDPLFGDSPPRRGPEHPERPDYERDDEHHAVRADAERAEPKKNRDQCPRPSLSGRATSMIAPPGAGIYMRTTAGRPPGGGAAARLPPRRGGIILAKTCPSRKGSFGGHEERILPAARWRQ